MALRIDNSNLDWKPYSFAEPPQLPVTIRDMEMSKEAFDMWLPLADPCPQCGAFNMRVGDYACWGACEHCANPT